MANPSYLVVAETNQWNQQPGLFLLYPIYCWLYCYTPALFLYISHEIIKKIYNAPNHVTNHGYSMLNISINKSLPIPIAPPKQNNTQTTSCKNSMVNVTISIFCKLLHLPHLGVQFHCFAWYNRDHWFAWYNHDHTHKKITPVLQPQVVRTIQQRQNSLSFLDVARLRTIFPVHRFHNPIYWIV